jgi:hypothetical protein
MPQLRLAKFPRGEDVVIANKFRASQFAEPAASIAQIDAIFEPPGQDFDATL